MSRTTAPLGKRDSLADFETYLPGESPAKQDLPPSSHRVSGLFYSEFCIYTQTVNGTGIRMIVFSLVQSSFAFHCKLSCSCVLPSSHSKRRTTHNQVYPEVSLPECHCSIFLLTDCCTCQIPRTVIERRVIYPE